MDQTQKFSAVLLGASGAVGRELVKELCGSPKWSAIHVIVRRKLEEWDQLEGNSKLKIHQVESLDALEKTQDWNIFQNFNSFFCCLGSRTKEGDAQFYKVDFTYCLYGGQIAKSNNINHFSLLTSVGADSKSMFLYMRTKGQIENAVKQLDFPFLSILRPGIILNRDNDKRFGETLLKFIPFFSRIECKDLARSIRLEAELVNQKKIEEQQKSFSKIYTNDDLLNLLH